MRTQLGDKASKSTKNSEKKASWFPLKYLGAQMPSAECLVHESLNPN